MNDFLLSTLLGIVEGLTEFLPVSSTAHLRIVEALLGVDLADGFWKLYSIVIQLGAILTLPIYFRRRIAAFIATFPGPNGPLNHPLGLVAVAFLCTAIPSFLLTKIIGKNLESLIVMACALFIGGVLMWIVDAIWGSREVDGTPEQELSRMSLSQSITIGLCQTLSALFPGTSRSMATIASGQLAGLSRAAALEFSFLLSIPTMAAATGYDLLKSLKPSHGVNAIGVTHIDAHGWTLIAIGFVVSFIVAYGVVAWFMQWVRRHGFTPFAIYRIIVGFVVLIWAVSKGAQ